MSATGEILDALVTLAEAAVSGLVAERGIRHAQELEDGALPHLFLYAPALRRRQLDWCQVETITRVELALVTRYETQEATLLKADAIRAAIDADPTLAGVVDAAFVSDEALREDARERDRIIEFVVETEETL